MSDFTKKELNAVKEQIIGDFNKAMNIVVQEIASQSDQEKEEMDILRLPKLSVGGYPIVNTIFFNCLGSAVSSLNTFLEVTSNEKIPGLHTEILAKLDNVLRFEIKDGVSFLVVNIDNEELAVIMALDEKATQTRVGILCSAITDISKRADHAELIELVFMIIAVIAATGDMEYINKTLAEITKITNGGIAVSASEIVFKHGNNKLSVFGGITGFVGDINFCIPISITHTNYYWLSLIVENTIKAIGDIDEDETLNGKHIFNAPSYLQ